MANKDLFKQAIADAKSIREAAIANAKLALEESLTPQLKELLAQRLAEMEEEDAPAAVVAEEATEEVAEESLEEAIGPDGLQAVAEAEEEGEEEGAEGMEGEEEAGEEAEGDSEESEDEAEEEEVGEMSVDDLKDLIRDVLMQVMGDEEAAQEDELEAGAEEMGAEDMTAVDDTEINIAELMAELALINDPEGPTAHGNVAEVEEADPLAEAAINELMGHLSADIKEVVSKFAESKGMTMQEVMKEMAHYGAAVDMKEVAKMLEAAHGLGEAACNRVMERLITTPMATMEEGLDENVFSKMQQLIAKMKQNAKEGKPLIDDEFFAFADKMDVLDPGTVTAGMAKSGAGRTSSIGEELNEALSTIETLRNELNETNLLNAKLLYVNKVFKANNLTESQKANVIAAFDKAETVKEVKLVYETVSENATATGKKEVVREAKGFASAATGASTKPAVIAEANAAVLRMQKLAGIIK
jgi:hypothetical protein